jgi:hypothetical protein
LAQQSRYVQQFEEALQAGLNGREESDTARRYFDGDQFTAAEKHALQRRKQPITPENLVKPKIEALCGLERQGRVDPKAYARVQSKEDDANAATDALRYVEQDQDLDIKKSKVFENMLIEGFGGVEITVRKLKSGVIDPYVIRIAQNRLYFDPHSAEPDFSDASYNGYITWMDYAVALKKWPGAEDVLKQTKASGTSTTFDTFDDKPKWASWFDKSRSRIRINTHYHLEDGVWHRCVFTLAGELEKSAPSVFIDDEGNPENPLLMQSAYVDQDNDRYGIVRDMIPLQDEVNKRRSKFLHMVNSNRWRISPSIGQDKELAKKELAKPDGVLVGDAGEVESLDVASKESGQFQLLMDSRNTLKSNIGPNGYLAGKQGESQSGRAVLAQQQAGMTEMTPLLDNLRHFTLRMYRQIWNRIRQYWNEERWIRVTDDDSNVRFVGLNVSKGHIAMQKLGDAVKAKQLPMEQAQQYAQQIQMDPAMREAANVVGELDVDIEIEEVNEAPTLQIEQFEQLTQLLSSSPILAQNPKAWELLIQASNLRDKEKLLKIVEEMQQQAAQPNPMQEQAQQIQIAGAAAQVDETKSKTVLNMSKAHQNVMQPMIDSFTAGQQSAFPPQLPAQ